MITNDDAIFRLHHTADRIREGHGENALFMSEKDALAFDLGASAIKTIDDMSDVFQKLITLTPSDIDTLTTFLKTHSVSEIVATIDCLNTKRYSASKYGKMIYADTDSIKIDVSRETSESVDE